MAEQRTTGSTSSQQPSASARTPVRAHPSPSAEVFLRDLLAAQCMTAPAEAGAIIAVPARPAGEAPADGPEVIARYAVERGSTPADRAAREWCEVALARLRQDAPPREIEVIVLAGSGPDGAEIGAAGYYGEGNPVVVLVPIAPERLGGGIRGGGAVGAYLVRGLATAEQVTPVARRLDVTTALIELFGLRVGLARKEHDLARLRIVLETLAGMGESEVFAGAAMALCNHIAAKWGCERVSLGLVRGAYVRLRAMSHAEKIAARTRLVQDIEAAMEECVDQDIEVLHPADASSRWIARAAGELASRHGPGAVLSLPLRAGDPERGGRIVGALTCERALDRSFTPEDVESLRLVCDLATPRLVQLERSGRWLGARIAMELRRWLALLVGPRHTWAKLAGAAAAGFLLFAFLAHGTYRVDGSFRLEASERRIVPAPFDGYIKEVHVDVGDPVADAGMVLATLDDTELRLELAQAKAELAAAEREVAIAQRDRKEAEAQIARARIEQLQARIGLLEHRIARAAIAAPSAGLVTSGDLRRMLGAPVRTGDVLFEVAPLDALRADIFVPEEQIADVQVGQRGLLAAASFPDRRIAFTVERIDPVAELRGGGGAGGPAPVNTFRVRARLDEIAPWMRPGMEGAARIDIEQRRWADIWSRRFVNWLRMKLWW